MQALLRIWDAEVSERDGLRACVRAWVRAWVRGSFYSQIDSSIDDQTSMGDPPSSCIVACCQCVRACMAAWQADFPLFTTIRRICEMEIPPSAIVRYAELPCGEAGGREEVRACGAHTHATQQLLPCPVVSIVRCVFSNSPRWRHSWCIYMHSRRDV